MDQETMAALQEVRTELQKELGQLDEGIAKAPNEASRRLNSKERARVQTQLGEVDRCIGNVKAIENNQPLPESSTPRIKPGSLKNVLRLQTAVTHYLLLNPGPHRIGELAKALNDAGVKVFVKRGPDAGKRIPIEGRHIKIMAGNYDTGFKSKGKLSPFVYDKVREEISLRPEVEEVEPEPMRKKPVYGSEPPKA